jgi:hypothetical protein
MDGFWGYYSFKTAPQMKQPFLTTAVNFIFYKHYTKYIQEQLFKIFFLEHYEENIWILQKTNKMMRQKATQ